MKITVVGDSAFATYLLANTCVDCKINLVSRMRLDARIFEFPVANKNGRLNLVGKRMPTFKQMLTDPVLIWNTTEILWYNGKMKKIEFLTGTSLWYGYGIRPVPIKWTLIRDLKSSSDPVVLFTLDLESHAMNVVSEYINCWPIEVIPFPENNITF